MRDPHHMVVATERSEFNRQTRRSLAQSLEDLQIYLSITLSIAKSFTRRDFPLGDLPMLEVLKQASENVFVPLTVGGGIRGFTDAEGKTYSALEVASEYFRSGADKVSIGGDAVVAAEEFMRNNNVPTGTSCIEQISKVYGAQVRILRPPYE